MTDDRPRIAVSGASGYIGSLLVRRFEDEGASVVALGRSRGRAGSAQRHYDMAEPPPSDLLTGVDVLVHCGWDLSLVDRDAAWSVNVVGTERLLDLARRSGLTRLVFISSMSAYDGTRQLYGRSKLAAERAAFDNGAAVLRLGLVYGQGWGGMVGSLKKMVELPVTPLVGASSHQFAVHEDDVVEAVARVIAAEVVPSIPLGIAHPDPVPFRALLEGIAGAAGATPHFVPFPWQVLYGGLRFGEALGIPLPFRSESLLGLVRSAPFVPNTDQVHTLGIQVRPFDLGPTRPLHGADEFSPKRG